MGDPRVRVAAIGPGGENVVRYACIISDRRSAAGRMGLGAVMGAKKLKAFAVRGHGRVALAVGDTSYVNPGRGLDKAKAFGFLTGVPAGDMGPEKARLISYMFPFTVALDSLLLCQFIPFCVQEVVRLLGAVTGWQSSLVEVWQVGQRALALGRLFNGREGFTKDDDVLPWRLHNPTRTGQHADGGVDREAWLEGRRWCYEMLGWNPETGLPTDAKLADLGLLWTKDHV